MICLFVYGGLEFLGGGDIEFLAVVGGTRLGMGEGEGPCQGWEFVYDFVGVG